MRTPCVSVSRATGPRLLSVTRLQAKLSLSAKTCTRLTSHTVAAKVRTKAATTGALVTDVAVPEQTPADAPAAAPQKKRRRKNGRTLRKEKAAREAAQKTPEALTLESILNEDSDVSDPKVLRQINKAIMSTRSLPQALKLVEDMAAAKIAPNEQTYVSLILVCRKQRQAERALVVYEAMKAASVTPSILTFNLILRCTAQSRRLKDAMRIKSDMLKAEVEPDATTYTILMEVVAKAARHRGRKPPSKRLLDVFALLDEMKAKNVTPTTSTYNVVIEACSLAQQVDQAMAVYLEMLGSNTPVDQTTFSLMMRCASLSGRLQHALAVFGEMKAAGVPANRDIYNHLIVACGNAPQPQVERAFEIFYEMQSEGRVKPNEVTFNALISAACKGGLPSYAFDAFEVMKTTDVAASRRTYNELIHAAGLRGIAGVEAAFEVYDSMRLAGEVPDQVTFGSLIAACARARDASRALLVFEEMREVGCAPSLVVYHALLVGLGRAGRFEEAVALYRNEMLEHEDPECRPTKATLSIMFDVCLGRDGAEAALAAAAGASSFGSAVYFHSKGAMAAKQLYTEAVESGMMPRICPELDALDANDDETQGMRSLRADIRCHTRSAAIMALLGLLDALKTKDADLHELVVMTGGRVRTNGPSRPSKLLLTAQALLTAQGVRSKPLSTLTVQALVVDKPALTKWKSSVDVPQTLGVEA